VRPLRAVPEPLSHVQSCWAWEMILPADGFYQVLQVNEGKMPMGDTFVQHY